MSTVVSVIAASNTTWISRPLQFAGMSNVRRYVPVSFGMIGSSSDFPRP
jgi:hypothetical protein